MAINFSSNATLIIDGHAITDLIEGDSIKLSFPNPATNRTNGANGIMVVSKHNSADVIDLEINVILGSNSDLALGNLSGIFDGSLAKTGTDSSGNDVSVNYQFTGGTVLDRPIFTDNNIAGNFEQLYKLQFRNVVKL